MNEENQVYILRGSITSTKPKATAYWNSHTHTQNPLSLSHTHRYFSRYKQNKVLNNYINEWLVNYKHPVQPII